MDNIELGAGKALNDADLDALEAIIGVRLPENCAIDIRELSAEEIDIIGSGRNLATHPVMVGNVARLQFSRTGDDAYTMTRVVQGGMG